MKSKINSDVQLAVLVTISMLQFLVPSWMTETHARAGNWHGKLRPCHLYLYSLEAVDSGLLFSLIFSSLDRYCHCLGSNDIFVFWLRLILGPILFLQPNPRHSQLPHFIYSFSGYIFCTRGVRPAEKWYDMVRILIFILLFVTRAMKAVEAARFFLLSLFLIIKTVDCIKSAVVVGAGPSGLASALVLAQRHG